MEKEEQFSKELGEFAFKKAEELGLSTQEMLENMSHCFVISTCAMLKEGVTPEQGLEAARAMLDSSISIMTHVVKA